MRCLLLMIITMLIVVPRLQAEELSVVQIYSQDELLDLIRDNKHLKRVRDDNCQLVEDIKARATKVAVPAYQFLYGDMLLYGVCIKRDAELGMTYIERAAAQGMPEALEQIGRYYVQGKFVQVNKTKAVPYLRAAAGLGHVQAQLELTELYLDGYGEPEHFEDAYRWLSHSVIADPKTHRRAKVLLEKLAKHMPAHVVARAKATDY